MGNTINHCETCFSGSNKPIEVTTKPEIQNIEPTTCETLKSESSEGSTKKSQKEHLTYKDFSLKSVNMLD